MLQWFVALQSSAIPYEILFLSISFYGVECRVWKSRKKKKKYVRAPESGGNERSEKEWLRAMGCWHPEGKR